MLDENHLDDDAGPAPIWTADDLDRFSSHVDPHVRSWALGRLALLDEKRAAERALTLVTDADDNVQREAIRILALTPINGRCWVLIWKRLLRKNSRNNYAKKRRSRCAA